MATESSTNATSSSWEYLYGQKVWAKWKKFYWPCLCYDPSQLGNVDEKLLQRSVNSVGRRYTLRYLGMSEIAAYGFISKNDVKIYEGLEDTLLNQDPSMVNKKYSKSMEEGLKLMRLEESVSYKFHEARNLERSRDPSRLDAEENDDDDSDNENYKGDDDDQIVNHVLLVSFQTYKILCITNIFFNKSNLLSCFHFPGWSSSYT